MIARRIRLIALIGLLGLMAGCSSRGEKLVPVEGQVKVNGRPAAGAIVTFHPINAPADAPRPSGQVAEDGTFRLTTTNSNDGAAPGEYRVTVAWYLASARKGVLADESIPQSQLPAAYNRPDATPLKATILPDQSQPVIFEIKKK
jgi:hypothetical protein